MSLNECSTLARALALNYSAWSRSTPAELTWFSALRLSGRMATRQRASALESTRFSARWWHAPPRASVYWSCSRALASAMKLRRGRACRARYEPNSTRHRRQCGPSCQSLAGYPYCCTACWRCVLSLNSWWRSAKQTASRCQN